MTRDAQIDIDKALHRLHNLLAAFIISGLMLAFLSACGSDDSSGPSVEYSFQFDTDEDFGIVSTRSVLTRRVRITNHSEQNARVDLARVTCSCVSASPEALYLKPGQHGDVVVSVDVRRSENRQRHAAVFSVSPVSETASEGSLLSVTTQEIPVVVSFVSQSDLEISPTALSVVANVGESFHRRILCVSGGIGGVDSNSSTPVLRVSCDIPEVVTSVELIASDNKSYVINVSGRVESVYERVAGVIVVETDNAQFQEISIPVVITGRPTVRAEPAFVKWGIDAPVLGTAAASHRFEVHLTNIDESAPPSRLRLKSYGDEQSIDAISATMDGAIISGSISGDKVRDGFVMIQIISGEDQVVAEVPVSWFAHEE